jgi:SAM-dependent methyltransferase
MYSPPDYSAPASFLDPRFVPWSEFLFLHRHPILRSVLDAAPVLTGRLLDVGCGTKPYASVLKCTEHCGIELQHSPNPKSRVDRFYDGLTFPYGDQEFDSVLCTEVIEHCEDPQKIMGEIHRVLKPGGHALITAPMTLHHHETPWDLRRFTLFGMKKIAEDAGLTVQWIHPRGGLFSVALGTYYLILGYSISRRPFSDLLHWCSWPLGRFMLWLDRRKPTHEMISLGWQMLVCK